MPEWAGLYVRKVDALNRVVGRCAMLLVFVMMAILLYSSLSKTFALPALWTLEMAQFTMVAFYLLGGPYALKLGHHVRMDLFYGSWSPETKARVDLFTALFLLIYLGVLLYGGFSSASYAIEYGERSHSAWRPYMWPIKVLACIGIFLMLLQAISELIKDYATARGLDLS